MALGILLWKKHDDYYVDITIDPCISTIILVCYITCENVKKYIYSCNEKA